LIFRIRFFISVFTGNLYYCRSTTTTLSIHTNVLVSVEYGRKRILCFLVAVDNGGERLRDLILFFSLSLSRFYFLASFFFTCICVIALVYYYSTSSAAVTAVFVLLFFFLRKLRTTDRTHVLSSEYYRQRTERDKQFSTIPSIE
jgi:hypothetical protein